MEISSVLFLGLVSDKALHPDLILVVGRSRSNYFANSMLKSQERQRSLMTSCLPVRLSHGDAEANFVLGGLISLNLCGFNKS